MHRMLVAIIAAVHNVLHAQAYVVQVVLIYVMQVVAEHAVGVLNNVQVDAEIRAVINV